MGVSDLNSKCLLLKPKGGSAFFKERRSSDTGNLQTLVRES